mmetsp:Transcript_34061/g.43939  ORF Transcript_34061/g.43939 Transcript_34061/m.43939 type:complete len:423 (-) Transcript_34061:101-1369(-)
MEASNVLINKAQGCFLGLLIGDALGASVEGFPPEEISELALSLDDTQKNIFINKYIPSIQMGSVTPLRTEIGYRWATEASDEQFVSPGPSPNPSLAPFQREGYFSDDGNSCIALAESLVECQQLVGEHVAMSYAKAWKSTPTRGYPPTAKVVLDAILRGVDYRITGKPPYFPFPDGSFANGGAMRISPLAIAYRNAPSDVLREACKEAVRSSHVHEEAIDGTVVQASAVRYALNIIDPKQFNVNDFLTEMISICETIPMIERLTALKLEYETITSSITKSSEDAKEAEEDQEQKVGMDKDFHIDMACLKRLIPHTRPGSGLGFQIASIDAIPCVLWFICRYAVSKPHEVLLRSIAAGGDTDTIASMAGAILGALYGIDNNGGGGIFPDHLVTGLENGDRGKDHALNLATQLCSLDLLEVERP